MWKAHHLLNQMNKLDSHKISRFAVAELPVAELQAQSKSVEKPDENSPFKSKDGMQSAIFGPAFWMTIHITSFNYPVNPTEEDKQNYATWLLSIGKILPCRYCRENFAQNMKTAGFSYESMNSRDSFSRFCYNLHDAVNIMLHKTSPPFEEIRDRYEALRAKCLTEKQKEEFSKKKQEMGCIRPVHKGQRGKCVISIVPINENKNKDNFTIHSKCMPN